MQNCAETDNNGIFQFMRERILNPDGCAVLRPFIIIGQDLIFDVLIIEQNNSKKIPAFILNQNTFSQEN